MAEDLFRPVKESDHFCFLSYKKENKELLRQIVPYLDFDVWYDIAVHYTKEWEESIARHICNSEMVVLFLSREVVQAEESFVVREYQLAELYHKHVLVVFLDDVSFQDVPYGLAFWFLRMQSKQCLMYDPARSREELVRRINEAVWQILHDRKETPTPRAAVQKMSMSLVTNTTDGKALYLGEGDLHLSEDGRKICLYNLETGTFEVRLTDDVNYTLFRFQQDRVRMRMSRIFYTPQRDYLYFIYDGSIHTCNMMNGKWHSSKGTRIRLERGERLTRQLGALGARIYLQTERNGCVNRIIHYNVVSDSVEKSWDMSRFRLKDSLIGLDGRNGVLALFTGLDDSLWALDMETGCFVPPTQENLQPYMADARYHLMDVNDQLSHDGLLYTVRTGGNMRVLDAETHALIDEAYAGMLYNLYLLKGRRVLKFDSKHNVVMLLPEGRKWLFREDDFLHEPAFEGILPMQMCYDEVSGLFIFALRVKREEHHCCKLVVTDERGRVVRISSDMYVPEAEYNCKISILQGELTVFLHTGDKRLADLQNTYIYQCEFR